MILISSGTFVNKLGRFIWLWLDYDKSITNRSKIMVNYESFEEQLHTELKIIFRIRVKYRKK